MSVHPTQEELDDLSLACQKLWQLDENRLEPGRDYGINVQGGKKVYWEEDAAQQKLFLGVSKHVWQKRTFVIFYNLLDNYERETGIKETVTAREKQETFDFLDAVMETKPMQYVHNYLVKKGKAPDNVQEFKQFLLNMWFFFYRREGELDSSGFEHVFVGEVEKGKVVGLHNWIQFYIEEAKGNLDYRGYIHPRRRGCMHRAPDGNERLLTVQLAWGKELKPCSTMFIGTSPEFEMAIYTLCFHAGKEENRIDLLEYDLNIKCFRIHSKYGDKVAGCFPEVCECE